MLALLIGVTLAAGFVRGFAGFGSSMIMVTPFIALMGTKVAIPAMLLLEILISIPLLRGVRQSTDYSTLKVIGGFALLFMPLGVLALYVVPQNIVQIGISCVIVIFAMAMAFSAKLDRSNLCFSARTAGALSGLFTGLAGVGGPPVVFFMMHGKRSISNIRSTLIVYFVIIDAVALGVFLIYDLNISSVSIFVGLAIAPLWVGVSLGQMWFKRNGGKHYRKVAFCLICLSASTPFFSHF